MSSMIGCCNLQIIPCPLHLWLCHIQAPSAASNYLLETQPNMIQMTDLKSYGSPASSLDLLHSCIAVHCFQSATYSMNSKYPPLQVSLHLPFRHTSIILSVLSLWPECMDLGALFLFVTAIVQKQDWCLTKAALFMGLLSITSHLQRWGNYLSQSSLTACGSKIIIHSWQDGWTCNTWE